LRRHFEAECFFGARLRKYFKRYFGDNAKDPERAAQKARHVEARHVFHDLAAKAQNLAARIQERRT